MTIVNVVRPHPLGGWTVTEEHEFRHTPGSYRGPVPLDAPRYGTKTIASGHAIAAAQASNSAWAVERGLGFNGPSCGEWPWCYNNVTKMYEWHSLTRPQGPAEAPQSASNTDTAITVRIVALPGTEVTVDVTRWEVADITIERLEPSDG